MDKPLSRAEILLWISKHCVVRRSEEPLYRRSGATLGWLIDLRPLLLNPHILRSTCLLLVPLLPETSFQLACREVAGIPLMVGLQAELLVQGRATKGLIVRKSRKRSGRLRVIEGTPDPLLPVIFVDDLLNSSDSAMKSVGVLSSEGLRVSAVIAIVDFDSAYAGKQLQRARISRIKMFSLREIDPTLQLDRPKNRTLVSAIWSIRWSDVDSWHITPKSTPTCDAEHLYFGTDGGHILCVRQADGVIVWKKDIDSCVTKGIWSSPALEGTKLHFGAYDGSCYALDVSTGRTHWQNSQADYVGSSPLLLPQHGFVVYGLEYAREHHRGGIAALRLDTGETAWHVSCPDFVHATATVLEDGKTVVIGCNNGELRCLDVATGSLCWLTPLRGAVKSRAAVTKNMIVVGTFANSIYALDPDTGKILWRTRTKGLVYSTPFIQGDVVYVACSDKNLHVIDLSTGALSRKISCTGRLFSSPREFSGGLYFGSTAGIVYRLDLVTADLRRVARVPGRITNDVIILPSGRMFVCCDSNSLYAFQL